MVRRKKTPTGPPPRRKKGTGTVYLRKSDGRWACEWDDAEKNHYIAYADSREEATKLLDAQIAKIKAGTFVAPDRVTVGEWLAEWFETTKKPSYSANSQYRYGTTLEARLKPSAISDIPLQKLTSLDLQRKLIAPWVEEGLKASTIHNYFSLVSVSLDSAVKHGIIAENPSRRVSLPKIEKKKQAALTLDQAQLLLTEVDNHWLRPWIIIAVGTGMRVGELASLRWDDVDFKSRIIHVGRNVARLKGGYQEGPPKTDAGRRDIVIPDFVSEELTVLKSVQLLKKRDYGLGWNNGGLVLPHENGSYRNPQVVNPAFKEKLENAGLPVVKFHGLRHSAFRIMQALGVKIEVIQQIAGHSSIEVTSGIYGDVSLAMQQEAMSKIDLAFKSTQRRAN